MMETLVQYRYDALKDEWVCEHVRKGVLVTMSGAYVREMSENTPFPEAVMFRVLVSDLLMLLFEHSDNPMDMHVLTRAFNADNMSRVMNGLYDVR